MDKLNENCSSGCTGSANVAMVTMPLGTKKKTKKKRKQTNESFDVILFKESFESNCPVCCEINDNKVRFDIINDKPYLYVNESLVKTTDKEEMKKVVDRIIECEDIGIELLEGFTPYDLDILLSEEMITPQQAKTKIALDNTPSMIEPDEVEDDLEKQHKEELKQQYGQKDFSIVPDDSSDIIDNQELVGYDKDQDSFVVKDDTTGDVKIVKSRNIKKAE